MTPTEVMLLTPDTIQAFFVAHPEWLDQVGYRQPSGPLAAVCDEPVLEIRTLACGLALVDFAEAAGHIRSAQAQRLRTWMASPREDARG